jgi:hypothetical protein
VLGRLTSRKMNSVAAAMLAILGVTAASTAFAQEIISRREANGQFSSPSRPNMQPNDLRLDCATPAELAQLQAWATENNALAAQEKTLYQKLGQLEENTKPIADQIRDAQSQLKQVERGNIPPGLGQFVDRPASIAALKEKISSLQGQLKDQPEINQIITQIKAGWPRLDAVRESYYRLIDQIRARPCVKLYHVGTLRKRAEPPPEKPKEVGLRTGPMVGPPTGFAGFYIGGNLNGNFNWLGQTETFKATNDVTNRFSDSSNAVGGGFDVGFLFSPWNNNILVGPSASIDILRQDTNHTFPPSPFFLGQTINAIGTLNGQIGVVARPGLFLYGELGLAVVNVDQKLNFSGPVTSVNQTVPGVNFGIGFAFQPANWQVAGIPVAVFGQYNHIILQDATFDNPGSTGFKYRNQNDIDLIKIGIRALIDPDAGKRLWRENH